MLKTQLQDLCTSRGFARYGSKPKLIARIQRAISRGINGDHDDVEAASGGAGASGTLSADESDAEPEFGEGDSDADGYDDEDSNGDMGTDSESECDLEVDASARVAVSAGPAVRGGIVREPAIPEEKRAALAVLWI